MADASDNAKEHRWWIRVYDLAVRRFAWWFWTAVIVELLVSGVVAWAFTPWKTDFSKYPVGSLFIWLRDHRSAFLIAGICLLALLVLLAILRHRAGPTRQRHKALALTREDRRRLLSRLHSLYEAAVKQSLWGVAVWIWASRAPLTQRSIPRCLSPIDPPACARRLRPARRSSRSTKTKHDLPQLGTAEEQQQQIFASYIRRMLERPVAHKQFTQQQTRCYLTWLAQQMQQQLTEFYLERLQLDWLPTPQARKRFPLLNRLLVALLSGVLGGVLVGVIFGPVSGLFFGLVIGPLFGLDSRLPGTALQPTETLSWSWNAIRRKSFLAWSSWLVGALLIAVFSGLVGGVLGGVLGGLLYILDFGLLSGLSGSQIDEHLRLKPNQGIQRSGRNALRMALIVGLSLGLSFGLVVRPGFGLSLGLDSGLLIGLGFGGTAYLAHYTLRFLLWRSGDMPWRYVRFLDEATERILLHRVGGGYRFIHPLFQEYFASGAATASPGVAPSPPP